MSLPNNKQARDRYLISPLSSVRWTRLTYCCCCGSRYHCHSSFAGSTHSLKSSVWMTTSFRWSPDCWMSHCCSCHPEANQWVATYLSCIHFQYTKSSIAETYQVVVLLSWPLQLQRATGFIMHTYICHSKMQLWLTTCYFCDFCHPVNCFDTLSICLLMLTKLFMLICLSSCIKRISTLMSSTCSRASWIISTFDLEELAR